MSGFSPELIDYLEGKISFEEFEKLREERKSKDKVSTAWCEEEGVSRSVQRAFASMLGEGEEEEDEEDDGEEDEEGDDEEQTEALSAGDVFALEIELNRENKKMLKERCHRSKLPKALRGLMGEANIRYARGDKEDAITMCMEIIRQEEVCSVEIPEDVPVDIRVKLMVCLIHMQMLKPLDVLLTCLMEQSPEEMGDLYLDVAEAFLDIGEYNSALPLLSALVCSERYNLPVVWLRHAECLKALGHMAVAVESYSKVVEMAPLHLDARISLSTLQQQLGRPEKALEALEPMHDPDTLAQDSGAAQQELKLLLHRSTLLKSQGKMYDYVDTLLTMLAMLLKVAMNRAQVCLISSSCSGERHLYLIKVSRDKISDIDDQEAAYLDVIGKTSVLAREDWWQLLLRSVYTLCELSRFKEAELLVDSSLEYYSFYDDRLKRKELEYFGLSAAILDKNFRKAYNYIRLMLMDNVDRPQLWNVFNQVTMQSQDVRHHRFCLRLMLKHPENHALCVLNGHNAFVSGSFKHALGQYVQAFRAQPSEPLYSLCVGLTFIHMASQKFVLKRHPLLLQGFSFLNRYLELRGPCQESFYNMGRALHQLGLVHLAIHYYQRALTCPAPHLEGFSFLNRYLELRGPCQESFYNMGRALHQLGLVHLAIHYYQRALTCPAPHLEGIEDDQVDLRREIAYNLCLIYQSSGNMIMARHLISTYCTI
ncbi:UNVERIFIED_CONTAM: hypothetical protein FKN15_053805 [Acipenser sinensis]